MTKIKIPAVFENIVPFIVAGIAIALFISILIMFYYVAVWGLIIGGILWLASLIKQALFPKATPPLNTEKKSQGRIIEHEDKK